MMETLEDKKLVKARKRIKELKGFYSHLTVYIIANLFILLVITNFFTAIHFSTYAILNYFSTPVLWGIGLLIHAIIVFVPSIKFIKNWEQRKMQELMDEENISNF